MRLNSQRLPLFNFSLQALSPMIVSQFEVAFSRIYEICLLKIFPAKHLYIFLILAFNAFLLHKCDRPRENRPISHLGMIVGIPVLKVVISITSFCSC